MFTKNMNDIRKVFKKFKITPDMVKLGKILPKTIKNPKLNDITFWDKQLFKKLEYRKNNISYLCMYNDFGMYLILYVNGYSKFQILKEY